MKIAIIDLGTNTCNLLVASINDKDYTILHRSKQLVGLGDAKIKSDEISADATFRVLDAFSNCKKIIKKYDTENIKVLATSAIRSASNKTEFLETLVNETGWTVNVISGEKEAELIFRGVLLALGEIKDTSVILDIGGGSNEFILAYEKEMIWKESRPTGMARVINKFKLSDPVNEDEISQLKSFYLQEHKKGFEICKDEYIRTLIGCSGSFDTISDIIDQADPGETGRRHKEISLNEFYDIYNRLIRSTRFERENMKGMDRVRIDLIVPAVILIEQLISETGIKKIIHTDYSLREGVLYETIDALINKRLKDKARSPVHISFKNSGTIPTEKNNNE